MQIEAQNHSPKNEFHACISDEVRFEHQLISITFTSINYTILVSGIYLDWSPWAISTLLGQMKPS